MKKLFAATAMVAGLLSCAGAATAGTYQGVASHDGTAWTVTWSNVFPVCSTTTLSSVGSPIIATVDGVEISMGIGYASQSEMLGVNSVRFWPRPAGVMSKLTFQGQDSFQCDGHTFLLPGYTPPAPAPIPTLSEWAMILFGVALAGAAAVTLHRRRTA